MNKAVQYLFIILFPFYPIWAWVSYAFLKKPVTFFVCLVLLPLALYYIVTAFKKLPAYLLCFLGFTTYHLVSVFVNDLVPKESSVLYFLLTDFNVAACLFFIVIEYVEFEEGYIELLTRNIFLVILLATVVSLVQIKNPVFFFNVSADPALQYVGEGRNFSIFSWINLNTAGITFPILVALALSLYDSRKFMTPMIILCGIVVSFLTKARYVMISAIVVLSQLFFDGRRSMMGRLSMVALFVGGIIFMGLTAKYIGVDVEEIINTRILEKQSDMASAKARVLSYEVFFKAFPEHPWLGVGPETKGDVIDALGGEAPLIHIGYLSYLYFYGVVGCSFLFLALFFLLRWAWQVGRQLNFWGSFYGLLTFVLANTTFVYFNFSEMGIVLAVLYLKFFSTVEIVEIDPEATDENGLLVVDNLPVTYE